MLPEAWMLDYDLLRFIWWALVGVLLAGFAIMGGFDLGIGTLLPFVAKSDGERRIMLNSIGATWEGNQVWFILGGGALFAAWPPVYAVAFSGFYIAMFLVLVALIMRPVGFDFRSKVEHKHWRRVWDTGLFIGGAVPSLVFGVAIGNLLLGVPFSFDRDLRMSYHAGFFELFHPFALLCGLVSLSMLVAHGAVFLMIKTHEPIYPRARKAALTFMPVTLLLFTIGGIWVAAGLDGYVITSRHLSFGPSDPLRKTVEVASGAWLNNYEQHPWLWAIPALAYLGFAVAWLLVKIGWPARAFIASGTALAAIVATVGASMYPFIIPSSKMPDASLTLLDSSSSHGTLFIMLLAAIIFVPIIAIYTSWVFHIMRGKVTAEHVEEHGKHLY